MHDALKFSQTLCLLRARRGWSQEVAAEKLRIPSRALRCYEEGERLANLPVTFVVRVACLYEQEVPRLLVQLERETTGVHLVG